MMMMMMRRNWTIDEDNLLRSLVNKYGHQWAEISTHFVDRKPSQIAARWEKCLDPNIVKGPFTDEEDEIVINFVKENGPKNWPKLAEKLKNRSAKQCRERWCNHLDPNVFHDPWTPEEDFLIYKYFIELGAKWSIIAKYIPGRPDNAIKNRYYSSISKRIIIQPNGLTTLLPDATKRKPRTSKLSKQRPSPGSPSSSPDSPNSEQTKNSSVKENQMGIVFDEKSGQKQTNNSEFDISGIINDFDIFDEFESSPTWLEEITNNEF
ncbi:Myb-like DNA-binding domain containing protein [Tritrichomonas foetus]|uniref:Myb-like DNA-binding domain containing protein n=1 Tax=Tritrichomonas foetus TaxID=1144522 RepID=A0A1J4JYV3_9EUKA|nr:Myb-like DNA-binding domain containing protein [Tritrichomonas foetus]|eukprot:OHT03874.1 Myb-like DNA-binding domain containing protein [Tritrichomonas foetus]